MKLRLIPLMLLLIVSCKNEVQKTPDAQSIIDSSIVKSGGESFKDHKVSFYFRNRKYTSYYVNGQKMLERYTFLDSNMIADKKSNTDFERFINDSLIPLPDSLKTRYANSVNSVHYFSKLPFGLNDKAVNKEYMGEETIKEVSYYKVKVTFDQAGGGDDFDDTYLYWFNKETMLPDYLAYDFHVNGGGQRFREAYNERYINGIRFVDYNNYKPKGKGASLMEIGYLFEKDSLDLLSKIELEEIQVLEN
ncbi:DUF6503 family protein [Flagellimonas meridianipacifica]|uniref:Deoxyribose-phosphate aldolase n=1 Tax=Flagellimonas meridianipacifica TaxID=1080225 RepID=A0A2T0MAM4_9FLAO|nr:DUF6503 family protein [Allomuricauda pacifica]PRX54530.1 hypothetical protein CLV81_2931 [Allomuricauda pacifica]